MDLVAFLKELAIVAAAGVTAAVLMAYIRLPAVAGLLLAGAVVGPYGVAMVDDPHSIELMAEVGVVLLLFTIGLEFSLSRFARIGRLLVIGGTLQVAATTGVALLVSLWLGYGVSQGVFFGFLFSMSSTAIVLRALSERRELDAPHSRFILGVMIFQDLCVVPMMLVVPLLAGKSDDGNPAVLISLALGKAVLVVAATFLLSRVILPPIFKRVDAVRSREVFLMAVIVVCIGTAYLTSLVGLSLALGAFLAGMVIAGSPFAQRALSDVLPLRDLFTSLFFLSLGMLFDFSVLLQAPLPVLGVFLALLLGKGLIASVAALVMRFPARVAWIAGVGLAQFGEFGFVLAKIGASLQLISEHDSHVLFAAGILTMFVTPLTMSFAPRFAAGAALLRPLERLLGARGIAEQTARDERLTDHVVIAGYGLAGRLLARALAQSGIPYLIIELNLETVREARKKGEPAYYADVTNEETLEHAHLRQARALILLINDAAAVRRAIAISNHLSPQTPVYVRSHYLAESLALNGAGAHDIVSEELEAGIEILARVLRDLGVPRNVVSERVKDARDSTQLSARRDTLPRRRLRHIAELDDMKIESFLVRADSHALGRSLADLRLRTETGALAIAVRHEGRLVEQYEPRERLAEGDLLYLAGSRLAVGRAVAYLQSGTAAAPDEPLEPAGAPG